MGIAERKEKQKLEIRKMILDASIKLFVEQGFENVSIRKIADIIEYSPTTVYLYFKDKNEILYSLHDMGFEKMAEYNKDLRDIKNPLVRLYKMGENYIQFGLSNPEYYDLMFILKAPMEVIERTPHCDWTRGDEALAVLQQTVAEAMEQGLIVKGDVKAASMSIWATVHGLVALTIRDRFTKLVAADQLQATMQQSLNWLLNIMSEERK